MCGRPVAQDFHPFDSGCGDSAQVGTRVAPASCAEYGHKGRLVPALAIDEHEGLVGPQSAQGSQVNMVGSVRARLLVEVERGGVGVQQRGEVKARRRQADLLHLDDVHGHGRFRLGAVCASGTRDEHLF